MTPPLHCPCCSAELERRGDGAYVCGCGRTFPEVAGIPDLRLNSDRYLSLKADRHKAERLARQDLSFEETVALYWSLTPEVPTDLAARYLSTAVDGVRRARAWLDTVPLQGPPGTAVDIGCGTGALAVALAERGHMVTGIDLALRWLVPAARLAQEHGSVVRLVAGDGRRLPFPARTFDLVVSVEALEHTDGQQDFVRGCLRAVRPGGLLELVTANRFSLAVEPNVGLWGVGMLPRRWAPAYVRCRRGTRYHFFRASSGPELRSWVGGSGLTVQAAPLPTPPLDASPARRRVQAVYESARQQPVLATALSAAAPYLELKGTVTPV